jgi:superfamily I DNA/RNA helicase
MLPTEYDPKTPPGEKRLFSLIKEQLAAENWTVLHSLGIAKHVTQMEGEADFLLVIPGKGILIIEVKSHLSLSRDANGFWILGNDKPTQRSPFKQARGQVHSIRQYLRKVMPLGGNSVPIASVVWFTEIDARKKLPPSVEWNAWELLDKSNLTNVKGAILDSLEKATNLVAEIKSMNTLSISESLCSQIVEKLRPKFEISLSSVELSKRRKQNIAQLTEEQFKYLDALASNKAWLVEGSAGTGKTFLAQESAARLDIAGQRVILLCRSLFLAQYLRNSLHLSNESFIGTADEFFTSQNQANKFDALVIDEAQDLIDGHFLQRIDKYLEKGIAESELRIFADYEGQRIYDVEDGRGLLRDLCTNLVSFSLIENCRNIPGIGTAALFLSGRNYLSVQYRRTDDSSTPKLLTYETEEQSIELLKSSIEDLIGAGYAMDEISVLFDSESFGKDRLLNALETLPMAYHYINPDNDSDGTIQISSIADFKGLDNTCVVVYGLEKISADPVDPMLYVSLSRARDRLIVISKSNLLAGRLMGAKS